MKNEELLVNLLKQNGLTISAAESCTGGMVAATITSVPGASAIIKSSIITYANEAKHEILGVKSETLNRYGAVSKETAIEMAECVSLFSKADVAISVTGNAGPDTMEGKPRGRVYIAVYVKKQTYAFEFDFTGDRQEVREKATGAAISTTLELLKKEYNFEN